MKYYDIYGNGTIIEVSNQIFLISINQLIELCFDISKSYIINHSSGLADFKGDYLKSDKERIQKQFNFAKDEIEDLVILNQLEKLFEILNFLYETDNQIIEEYSKVIMEGKKSKKIIKNLKQEVYKFLYKKRMPMPIEVSRIAEETKNIIPELENSYKKAHERITNLLSQNN